MFRIIYHKNTGYIERCMRMSDEMLAKNLQNNSHWAYLDGKLDNVQNKIVNLQSLTIEDRVADPVDIPNYIRSLRATHLRNSDWTQMPDSPLSAEKRAEWAAYRQALRDMTVTQQVNTIEEIVWPARP